MSKLTVKEYSTIHNISVQSVYKRINSGNLEIREINNIKYIIIDDLIDYEKKFNDLQVQYNSLKEILFLKDEIINELKDKQRLFNLLLPAPSNKPENEGLKEFKKKKKKKKKFK
jgi:hypothetical protein